MTYPLVDHALSLRLERAEGAANCRFVETRAALDPGSAACWLDADGTWAMFDGVGSPLTQTFCLGMSSAASAETLATVERFYAERGSSVEHEVSPLAEGDPLPLLSGRGYVPIELTSVLFRPTAGDLAPAPPGRDLHVRVTGPSEAGRWAETAADGWSELPELVPFVRAIGTVYAHMADARCFLVEQHGEPAAAGVLVIHEGTALLGGASTRPGFRRQGAQLALLGSRLAAARAAGCDLAVMSARPGSASQRNAERHGFRIAYTRTKWRRAVD